MKILRIHLFLFVLGYSYYYLTPCLFSFGLIPRDVIQDSLADPFTYEISLELLLFGSIAPVAFLLGSGLCKTIPINRSLERVDFRVPRAITFAISVLTIFLSYRIAPYAFTGYEFINSTTEITGPLATLLFVSVIYLLLSGVRDQRLTFNALGFCILTQCVLLLSVGGRLYVLTSLIAIMTYVKYKSIYSDIYFYLLLSLIFGGAIIIGIWRLGDTNSQSIQLIFAAIFGEAIFTSYSLFSYFSSSSIQIIDFGHDFYNVFLSLIPSLFWPGKGEELLTLMAYDVGIYSPHGAIHGFTSAVANFGIIGGLLFFQVLGLSYGVLHKLASRNSAFIPFYFSATALLPFMCFREHYIIQLKLLLIIFIIIGVSVALKGTLSYRLPRGGVDGKAR